MLSPTRMVVRMTVAPGAALGFRDVRVDTPRGDGSTESASAIGAVQVVGAPAQPSILSVTPSAVARGRDPRRADLGRADALRRAAACRPSGTA